MTSQIVHPAVKPVTGGNVSESPRKSFRFFLLTVLSVFILGLLTRTYVVFTDGTYTLSKPVSSQSRYSISILATQFDDQHGLITVLLFSGVIIALAATIVFTYLSTTRWVQTVFAALFIIILMIGTVFSLSNPMNQQEDRANEVQTKIDTWISETLHVPNNYKILRKENGDIVVGDFIKTYNTRTTTGEKITLTITREKNTYTAQVVE